MEINCAYTEIKNVDELVPHPRNPNKHPKKQIEMLAKILRFQGWRSPIVVSKRSGFITKGHGRLEAAKLNGWEEVPVDLQRYDSEAKEWADIVADNEIASLAKMDMDIVVDDSAKYFDLDDDFEVLGIEDFKEKFIDIDLKKPLDDKKDQKNQAITCPNCSYRFNAKNLDS